MSITRLQWAENKDGTWGLVKVNVENVGSQTLHGSGTSFSAGGFIRGLMTRELAARARALEDEAMLIASGEIEVAGEFDLNRPEAPSSTVALGAAATELIVLELPQPEDALPDRVLVGAGAPGQV